MSNFAFQVNSKLSVFHLGRKPINDENHTDFKEGNTVRHWNLVDDEGSQNPQQQLIKSLEQGLTIRYGVKEKSNRKEDFEYADGTAIDLDCENLEDLQNFLSLDISKQAFYRHPSFSFDAVSSFGYRLHYRFNRRVTDALEMKMINYALMLELKPELIEWFQSRNLPNLKGLDKSCNDPARIWYSGDPKKVDQFKSEGLIVQDLSQVLNVDILLEYLEPEVRDYVSKSHERDLLAQSNLQQSLAERESSFSKEFYEHLDRVLGTNNNPHAIIIPLQSYLESCGCTVAGWHEHTSPGSAVWQYRSADPLDPNGSETSDSFAFSRMPDGSYVWNSGKYGASGDLVLLLYTAQSRSDTYITYLKHSEKMATANHFLEHNGFAKLPEWKPSPEQQQRRLEEIQSFNGEIPGLYFTKKGQPQIDPQSVLQWFLDQHTDRIKYCPVSKEFHFYFDTYWASIDFDLIVNKIVNSFCSLWSYVSMGEESIPMKRLFSSGIVAELKTQLKLLDSNEFNSPPLQHQTTHIPFLNGLFNVKTKQLEPFHPSISNVFVQPFEYQPSTGKGLELLRELLGEIVEIKESIDDLIDWMACCVQYKAYDTRVALGFVGEPNSGKSYLTNLISRMVQVYVSDDKSDSSKSSQKLDHFLQNSIVKRLKAHTFLREGERFATVKLIGIKLGIFTEFNGIPKDSDGSVLKDLIADPDSTGSVVDMEYKGGKSFNGVVRSGFITNSQEFPKLPVGDHGWNRRFIWCKTVRTGKDISHLFQALDPFDSHVKSDPELYKIAASNFVDLWASLIERDVSSQILRFRYSFDPEWLKAYRQDMMVQNNKYYQFARECLQYDPSAVGIEATVLFNTYEGWCNEARERFPGTRKQFGTQIKPVIQEMFKIPENEVTKRKTKGIIYQKIRLSGVTDDD